MNGPIWIIGAAGHAKVIIQSLKHSQMSIGGVVDDDASLVGTEIVGIKIQATSSIPSGAPAVIAIGNNLARKKIVDRFDLDWQTVIHSRAFVDPTVSIGAGTVVMAGAVIQPDTTLGKHVIVNTRASIDHDGKLGDFCHVCPGATLAGNVTLGDQVMVGTGANIIPGVTVGHTATIGAGACVIENVKADNIAIGVPARSTKQ